MKKSVFYLFFLLTIAGFISCKQKDGLSDEGLASFNKDSMLLHVKVLASDSFQGRKPFSLGETRAVEYMKTQFEQMGLEPANGNSYIQDVPMVEIKTNADNVMHVQSAKGNFDLKKMEDFVVWTEKTDLTESLKNEDVIFAGYGVVAPEYGWNDYKDIDVKGKVVMVLVNDPGFGTSDTTMFKGKTMTYYGRWTYKYEEAARQGAKACLIIHNTQAASYPFSVVQTSNGSSKLFLDERANPRPHLALQGWVSADAAKKILAAAGKDSSLIVSANNKDFKSIPLGLKISLNATVTSKYNMSHNVIAKITGSKRPDEYIIYTAHWDHLGIGKPDDKGDSIYNGALDNASGCAGLLEIARAFKSLKEKPERSIIFLSVTAEEQGLLGSQYYAQHPIYPLNKTVANINMDGVNTRYKTNDVVITGVGQNELEDYLVEFVKQQGRYVSPEAHPEAGHYYRSDHFNFAKVGVPALDCGSGIDVTGKGKDFGKQLQDEYTAHHYHQPSDNFNPEWTFEGGIQDLQLLYLVGKKLSGETTFPKWKEGSEFKAVREKQL